MEMKTLHGMEDDKDDDDDYRGKKTIDNKNYLHEVITPYKLPRLYTSNIHAIYRRTSMHDCL